ncbi:MAG: class I SAM-dependent methyltransferase [Candidatus Kapaibacterium sp.]
MGKEYSEEVVLRVNELFHDLTSEQYQRDVEGEMLQTEGKRWRSVWEEFISKLPEYQQGIHLVDIGTGTGFVPLSIVRYLSKNDHLTCSDVSRDILNLAQKNLAAISTQASIDFVKLSTEAPFRLPFAETQFNVVTMNSVLHHLKETSAFLDEINRILKPGGLLVIGHEPNRKFYENLLLRIAYQTTRMVFTPKEGVRAVLRKTGMYGLALKFYYALKGDKKEKADEIAEKINRQLIEEGLIESPLRPEEIPTITDIRDAEGFDPNFLLPDYELLHLESYNYLRTVDLNRGNNMIVRRLSNSLAKRYPGEGATFLGVWRKNV